MLSRWCLVMLSSPWCISSLWWDSANSGFGSLYFSFFPFRKQDCSSNFDRTGCCICKFAGVDSVSVDRKANKMTVIGDGIDPVVIMCQLRKFFHAEIIAVGPAKEPEKKIEPKKKEQKQQEEGQMSKDEDQVKKDEDAFA